MLKYLDINLEKNKTFDKTFSDRLCYFAAKTATLSKFDDNVPTKIMRNNISSYAVSRQRLRRKREQINRRDSLCTKMIFCLS